MVLPLTDCFCVQKIRVLPNSLPNITLDNPYYAKININFRFVERHFSYQIEPENSGLLIIPLDSRSIASYDDLRVKGIPKILGTIIINSLEVLTEPCVREMILRKFILLKSKNSIRMGVNVMKKL